MRDHEHTKVSLGSKRMDLHRNTPFAQEASGSGVTAKVRARQVDACRPEPISQVLNIPQVPDWVDQRPPQVVSSPAFQLDLAWISADD